jgi:hypothetical protein
MHVSARSLRAGGARALLCLSCVCRLRSHLPNWMLALTVDWEDLPAGMYTYLAQNHRCA